MKIKGIALMALAASMVLGVTSSCKKEDHSIAGPEITVRKGNETVKPGTPIEPPFDITVKVNEKTKIDKVSYVFKYKNGNNEVTSASVALEKDVNNSSISGKNEVTIRFTGEGKMALPSSAGKFIITALDKNGTTSTYEQTIGKAGSTPTPNPGQGETKMKDKGEGYISHAGGQSLGAFNLKTGKPVSAGTAGKAADRYMINNTPAGENQVFVPGWVSDEIVVNGSKDQSKNYTCKGNGTVFAKADSKFDYDNATVEACRKVLDNGSSKKVASCAVGDVFVAQMGSEIYVLKIKSISKDKNRANVGHITFMYKSN